MPALTLVHIQQLLATVTVGYQASVTCDLAWNGHLYVPWSVTHCAVPVHAGFVFDELEISPTFQHEYF